MHHPTTAPDAGVIADLAELALASIPAGLRAHVTGVGITVAEMPDAETLEALGIESEWELTGLYHGTPLGQRITGDIARPAGPDLSLPPADPARMDRNR